MTHNVKTTTTMLEKAQKGQLAGITYESDGKITINKQSANYRSALLLAEELEQAGWQVAAGNTIDCWTK